jgi:hypothetical protein
MEFYGVSNSRVRSDVEGPVFRGWGKGWKMLLAIWYLFIVSYFSLNLVIASETLIAPWPNYFQCFTYRNISFFKGSPVTSCIFSLKDGIGDLVRALQVLQVGK